MYWEQVQVPVRCPDMYLRLRHLNLLISELERILSSLDSGASFRLSAEDIRRQYCLGSSFILI